jgi:nitrite reductase (NO-forming)
MKDPGLSEKHSLKTDQIQMSRSRFLKSAGLLAASGAMFNIAACNQPSKEKRGTADSANAAIPVTPANPSPAVKPVRVAGDPLKVPPPVNWNSQRTHKITLVAKEVIGEIKPGVLFRYLTFDGLVPAPMLRVRQGDSIDLTLVGDKSNHYAHDVDFHSCYGTGGGAAYTNVGPGQTKRIKFQTRDPAAFIYHCAVPDLDFHISSGMFGLILVEPKGGLPPVDREFYLGQHGIYVKEPVNDNTPVEFDTDSLLTETPRYVVLNGAFNAFTPGRYGSLKAKQGETIRIYFVNGGPNLISSFHPIGNIWSKFWMQGSLANEPFKLMQTVQVNPGSCAILEMKLPVPETIHLADHSITRTARQGLLASIEVSGKPVPDIFESETA